MTKKKSRLENVTLQLTLRDPAAEIPEPHKLCVAKYGQEEATRKAAAYLQELALRADADGHVVAFDTANDLLDPRCLVEVYLPMGMSPRTAASLLHKLAKHLERCGHILLNQPPGAGGYLDTEGNVEMSAFSMTFDDFDENGQYKMRPFGS
jgi:hypothetical protein